MNYLALPVSSGRFIRAIHVSNYSRTGAQKWHTFHVRGHYPLGHCFPAASVIYVFCNSCRTSTELLSYNPTYRSIWFGLVPFRSPLLRESRELLSIRSKHRADRKQLAVVFFSSGYWDVSLPQVSSFPINRKVINLMTGFPHSDTSGSKPTNRLPEAFRRLVTSFIAFLSQGIHRAPFTFPVRKPEHHNICVDAIFIIVQYLYWNRRRTTLIYLLMHIRMSKFTCLRKEKSPLRGGCF